MKKKRIVSLKLLNWIIEKLAFLSPIVLYERKKHSTLIFRITAKGVAPLLEIPAQMFIFNLIFDERGIENGKVFLFLD